MTAANKEYWISKAASLQIEGRAFIDGAYCEASNGGAFDCVSPIDGQVIAKIAATTEDDVNRAVAAAKQAFDSGIWANQSPGERKAVLLRFADLIAENREELALLETLDMGKPISDSLNVDINLVDRDLRWYAEAIDKVYDELAPAPDNVVAMVTREPVGVVAAVVPWNFPLMMAAWKFAPALALGNSVIIKPAEQSSLTAIRVAALAKEAGLPDGVFQVLPGLGHVTGKALGLHMDVDALAFTGSTQVGKYFLEYSGQSNMKYVALECGGKSPNIIFDTVKDLDYAVETAAGGIFFNQGEVCVAGSRLLVQNSIKDAVIAKLKKHTTAWTPGHPLDPATSMGAIVDNEQHSRILDYVEKGKTEGATLTAGGSAAMTDSGGYFIEPTIFDGVTNDMCIAREEIFGPVLAVIGFDTVDEAIQIANDSDFGLAAAVWTGDLDVAHKVSKRLKAGTVWVNCYDESGNTVPFGGYKQSGIGRDKSLHALDKYSNLKSTWIKLNMD